MANRYYRYWSKHGNGEAEHLEELWNIYLQRKTMVHEKIKAKKVKNRVRVIMRNCMTGTKNTRSYWRMLRRLNKNK